MKETISIRLDKDLAEKLDELCKMTGKSAQWLTLEAIKGYLAEFDELLEPDE